jgi:hypothetical protein
MNVDPSRESLPEGKSFPESTDANFVSCDCEPAWQKFLISAFVFLWPFVYFWRQVLPLKGEYIGIGMDFEPWYYVYKVYLLDNLSRFKIPLWSPAEAAGFPFYSSPLTQTFYPLNIFLAIFYKLAGGYTRLDHQIFTILGVSIFALGLFFWLRQLNLNLRAVLFATLIMSVSFKVAEILRFPNAVHTAAWYPWILFCITNILQKPSVKELARYGGLLVVFLFCFFTGGYPYFIYYSLFLFPPYLLLFLIPKLRYKLFGTPIVKLKNSILSLLVTVTFSLLIWGLYLYQMNLLLKETVGRGGGDFEFATKISSNYVDTIGSLIFPPIANPEGWFYFGFFGVFLILIYFFRILAIVYSSYAKPPKFQKCKNLPWYQDTWIIIIFLIWIGIITYITYGRNSALFIFLWKYMPFFSRLRVWNRLNIILVPILCWLLAIAYNYFEELISQRKNLRDKRRAIYILVGSYVTILIIQYDSFTTKLLYDPYWGWYFRYAFSKDVLFLIFGVSTFFVLLSILKIASKISLKSRKLLGIILMGGILLSAVDMSSTVGTSTWIEDSPLKTPTRYRLNVAQLNRHSFTEPRIETGTLSLTSAFSVGDKQTRRYNWYFSRYVQFLDDTEGNLKARRQLMGVVDGRKIYYSKAINYTTIEAFLADASQFINFERVISYTGDELVLEVNTITEGYLSFIDNWDSDWEATVDAKQTQIQRLFGLFKSVHITAGEHRVTFAYRPKFFKIFANKSDE